MNFHWLLPEQKGIPVLMYHRIWPDFRDRITQTPEQLEEQFLFLKQKGYQTISLPEYLALVKGEVPMVGNKVLITFDDGYYNNLAYVYPLLKRLQMKATFFIIGDSLEGNLSSNDPLNRKMDIADLQSLDSTVVQLAMHGFHHENFKTTPAEELKQAMLKTIAIFKENNIFLHKALAYPFGGRPKDTNVFNGLKQWMLENGIEAAFRIGNAVSRVPAPDMYELKRIDIRGTDSLEEFKIKLRKGKLNPF